MCNHADQTKQIIDHLSNEVYKTLELKIKKALDCKIFARTTIPEKQIVVDLILQIKDEFHSLITYEQKLVFPSVLKVFLAKKVSAELPDLANLFQLTNSKEHKLINYVRKMAIVLNKILWDTQVQDDLVSAFLNDFLHEKMLWNKMIQERISSCGCFKKNYFDMVQLKKNETEIHNPLKND